jgi:hypothetical protein
MVVVVMLVVLCATITLTVASSSLFGSVQTASDRSRLDALSAAEAGRDALLAQLQTTPAACPATRTTAGSVGTASYAASAAWAASVSASAGNTCPSDGTIRITSVGTAADGTAKTVSASYPYRAATLTTTTATNTAIATATTTTTTSTTVATAQGAIIQGNPATLGLNIPTVVVNDGDLVVASTGLFDCNSKSVINGDLIVPNGTVSLSNQCSIKGNVYAKGDIQINNLANHVTGDVVSTAGNVNVNTGSVDGSVQAAGTVTIQNGVTIGNDVVSGGTGLSGLNTFYNSTVKGSVSVAGTFASFQTMKVTGNVTAAGTSASSVAPDTTIGGNLKLGGDISTWNGGPTVKGTITTRASGLSKPTLTTPAAMGRSTWLEIPWKKAAWTGAGWAVQTATTSQCDYQNNPALVTAVNALTVPTVIDASACAGGLNLYGVTLSLRTNVTFIAPAVGLLGLNSAQNLTVNANGAGGRTFNLIVPDATSTDNAPTCPLLSGSTTIYGAKLGAGVSGVAYSPCTLAFGQATWTGQIIAGYPDPSGGNVTVGYQGVAVPGATGPASSGTATLAATAVATTTTTAITTTTATVSTAPSMTPSLLQQTEP